VPFDGGKLGSVECTIYHLLPRKRKRLLAVSEKREKCGKIRERIAYPRYRREKEKNWSDYLKVKKHRTGRKDWKKENKTRKRAAALEVPLSDWGSAEKAEFSIVLKGRSAIFSRRRNLNCQSS